MKIQTSSLRFFVTSTLVFFSSVVNSVAQDLRYRTYGGPTEINGYTFPYRRGGSSFDDCVASPTYGDKDPNCLADFFTVGQINDRKRGPYASMNDEKVFRRWGFLRDTRPRRWDCHINLKLSVTNWFKTSRCIDQLGSDKYEKTIRGEGLLAFIWKLAKFDVQRGQEYKRDVLQQIHDSERNDIPKLIRHAFKANASRPIVFEIGNEPNIFPAMEPETYGWYLNMYAKTIRQSAAAVMKDTGKIEVKIMAGGLWIFDGMPDYFLGTLNQGVHISFGSFSVKIPIGFKYCGFGIRYPCGIKYKNIELTEGWDVKSKFYTDVASYWNKVIAQVGEDRTDIANLHFYPYISRDAKYGMDKHLTNLGDLAAHVSGTVATSEVWLTEVGNFNPLPDREAAQKVISPLFTGLEASNFRNITRWYYFKAEGNDKKFKMLPKGGLSRVEAGIWAALFEALEWAVDQTLGGVTIKKPTISMDTKTKFLKFIGQFGKQNPAQGLYDGKKVLTKIGAMYHRFATT